MDNNKTIKNVIYHFCDKYKGNWEIIYSSIKNKEPIVANQLKTFNADYNFISIVDENYPNNFKEIYMPPLCIFSSGNRNLIHHDDQIISVWSDLEKIKQTNLKKEYIYALIYKTSDFKMVNELLACGYKLILITEQPNLKEFNFFKSLDNCLIISEYIPGTKIDKDQEQSIERILLGISKKSLVLSNQTKDFKTILPLFKFEQRPINVMDLSNFNQEEINQFNLVSFNY